ncbi:MAG: nitrilase-related carbon-nitrogen hydrolase [Bacteroidia bacterium]|nr:nitrilase-related carbon-nitrogen hydrolase [Bacteroidia bacterium]
MKYIKVAGASVNQTPMDWQGNQERIVQAILQARQEQVGILCLPELAISGYGCEDMFFSDYVPEYSLKTLLNILPYCENIVVSVGLPLVYENMVFNTVALIQNQKILGFVAKQELAGDGIHYEPRWFKKWTDNLVVKYEIEGQSYPLGDLIFEIDGVRIGFEICEDAWNGVRPAQNHYLNNVDIILNPSASHFAFGKTKVRETLVRETSRSYACAYVYSNLLGNEAGRVIYDGEILIAQGGNLLARHKRFSFQDYQVHSAVIDVHAIRRWKKKSFNFKAEIPQRIVVSTEKIIEADPKAQHNIDIEPFESKELEFYKAECLGLFDYMRKSRSQGFVLSLSGGADSSASAVLCASAIQEAIKELGIEGFKKKLSYLNIDYEQPIVAQLLTCVYQRTSNSSEATLLSAKTLAQHLGATFYCWDIQEFTEKYTEMIENSLQRKLTWEKDDLTLQNIQARVRAPGIWMVANAKKALLITTSNRSEAAVGYCTMDGDTCGGLAPLAGIDKASLLAWLRWAYKELNIEGLKYVIDLKPGPELRPKDAGQTAEGDLMPYAILDKIEKCAIRDYKSPVEVFNTLKGTVEVTDAVLKAYIKKFFTLWCQNQWKRERYAPSFHLDDENLDPRTWCRFPILNGGYRELLHELENMA